jgi:hypothetical protein
MLRGNDRIRGSFSVYAGHSVDRNKKMNTTASAPSLRLNAFSLIIDPQEFRLFKEEMLENKELKGLREKLKDEWFLTWKQGIAYGIPTCTEPSQAFGRSTTLRTDNYLGLAVLNARANELLPSLVPKYQSARQRHRRGIHFVAQKVELVREITENWNVAPIVGEFKIRPRFNCETRLVELRNGHLQIILVLGVAMSWSIEAELMNLADAGIDLDGLYVIRRNPVPGQRRLLGRIESVQGLNVVLSETYDSQRCVRAAEVQLEGSRTAFARCLKTILGARLQEFETRREERESQFVTGPGLDNCLTQFVQQFKKEPFALTEDVKASVGDQVSLQNSDGFQTAIELTPVEYCFDAAKTKRNQFAWNGLDEFGPYSMDSFPKRSPRILVVCPNVVQPRIEQALRHLKDGIPNTRFRKGFERVFHVANMEFAFCTIALSGQSGSIRPEVLYHEHVEKYLASDSNFDAAVVVIMDEYAGLPDERSPYLFAKALLLTNGIAVQEARVSTLTRSANGLQYVFQNLSVALYAKMGGTPWTVNQDTTVNDEIVIGMGMAELSGSRFDERQRYMGITTVFRGDGNYLLSSVSAECRYDEYPKVLEKTMTDVLAEIRQRNGWRKGDTVRVVFHASKPLRNLEVDKLMEKCVKESAPEQNIQFAFLDVLHNHPFRVFDYSQPGRSANGGPVKGKYVPKRGLAIHLGKDTRLLSGNGLSQIKRPTTPLPTPLLIHLHPHSTGSGCDLTYLTDQILKFTSLTWRSTQPAYSPVTIYYSELIAELLVRLKKVPGWSAAPLNTKLRSSKWFL